jgi:hypothetical protein
LEDVQLIQVVPTPGERVKVYINLRGLDLVPPIQIDVLKEVADDLLLKWADAMLPPKADK